MASVGDAEAEALGASERVGLAQVEGARAALVTSGAHHVLLAQTLGTPVVAHVIGGAALGAVALAALRKGVVSGQTVLAPASAHILLAQTLSVQRITSLLAAHGSVDGTAAQLTADQRVVPVSVLHTSVEHKMGLTPGPVS